MRKLLPLLISAICVSLVFIPVGAAARGVHGGVGISSGGTGDPAIAPVGQWIEWTNTGAGDLTGQYPASSNDGTGCGNYEGANVAACTQNKSGDLQLTASASGATLTVTALSALTTGSTTVSPGNVLADPLAYGLSGNVPPGTFIASGTCTSGTLPCTLTLNKSVGTITSQTMVTNPPALQASSLNTTIKIDLSDIFGNSGSQGDPGQGCFDVWQPGGHAASQTNGVASLCVGDVENASGPANWTLQQPPSLLYQLADGDYTSQNPSYIGQIVAATYQTAGPGAVPYNQTVSFWNGPNANGTLGPVVVHQYNFVKALPNGWASLMLDGGGSGGHDGADNLNSFWVLDNADYSNHGPYHLPNSTAGSVTFHGSSFGYAPRFSGNTAPSGSSAIGPDGFLYAIAPDDAPGPILGVLTCPQFGYQNSCTSTGWVFAGNGSGSGCWPDLTDAAAFWDPGNAGQIAYTLYSSATGCTGGGSGTTGPGHLEILTNITPGGGNPATSVYHNLTITGTIPSWLNACVSANNCGFRNVWDPDDNELLVSDGSWHLGAISIGYSSGTYSASMTDLTSTLGTPPPDPTTVACTSGGASNTGLFYQNRNAYHQAVMSFCGRIFAETISHGCPASGTPTPDLSMIYSPSPCTLKDASGNSWVITTTQLTTQFGDQRQANYQITKNGTYTVAGYQLEVAQSGNIFAHQACGPTSIWEDSGTFQVPSPTGAAHINHAVGTNPSLTLYNLASFSNGALYSNGQTVTIQKQTGVNFWGGDYTSVGHGQIVSGIRIVGQAGAALYCGEAQSGGIIEQYNDGTDFSSNLMVQDLELGYAHSTSNNGASLINDYGGAPNLFLLRMYMHDASFLLETSGANGVIAVTGSTLEHGGGNTASSAAAHNVYLSVFPPNVSDNGVGIFYGDDIRGFKNLGATLTGFEFKSRLASTSLIATTIATPEVKGKDNDLGQQTAMDFSCGGQQVLGQPDATITPASLTSSGLVATITLPTATASAETYNSSTGEVDLTVPSMQFFKGTPISVSGATGTGSFAAINGEWISTTGNGTTLTFFIAKGLTMTLTGATIQYELPYQTGQQFLTTIAGASQAGYNGSFTATAVSKTTFTYPLGTSQTSPATGSITYTMPGGVVIELGPNTLSGPQAAVRYMAEVTISANCPAGGTGYGTNSLAFSNCWIINDSGLSLPVAYAYGHTFTGSIVNCKVVGFTGYGTGVTDSGGNTQYPTRAAAGLLPYPNLPMPNLLPANDNFDVPANENWGKARFAWGHP